MIDFRYHIVSLISVFLALAVGIVLGAGPLKEAIGDTLTGEVEQLRTRAAELRTEADNAVTAETQAEGALAAVGPDLLDGVLGGRRVAIIELGGTDAEVLDAVASRLTQAGGVVTGTVHLADDWTDPARSSYRQTLAGTLVEYLDPQPAADAGSEVELAEALVQGLSTAVPENPDALAEPAGVVMDLLAQGELITIDAEITLPADAIVIVSGSGTVRADSKPDVDPTDEAYERLEAWVEAGTRVAVAAQARTSGVVVASSDMTDEGLLARVRTTGETQSAVSTVADVDTLVGELGVGLALAQRISGTVGHYGPDDEATAAMPPRVVLPPIARIAGVTAPAGNGGVAGTGGTFATGQ